MKLEERIGSARITSAWTEVAGGLVHYRTNAVPVPDRAPPVLLLHGFVISSTFMIPLAREMAPFCRLYAPDLPGYGRSFHPPKVWGPEKMADILAEFMDRVGLDSAFMVANSYGCQTLAEFGARHPGRVRRMVLVGPTTDPEHRTLSGQALRLLLTSRHEDKTLGRLNRREYRQAGLRTILATARNCIQHPVEETLPRVRVPVLVVRGAHDAVVNQRWAREVVELLPDAELEVVPGAGHAVNYSHPHRLCAILLPYFGIRAAAGHAAA